MPGKELFKRKCKGQVWSVLCSCKGRDFFGPCDVMRILAPKFTLGSYEESGGGFETNDFVVGR